LVKSFPKQTSKAMQQRMESLSTIRFLFLDTSNLVKYSQQSEENQISSSLKQINVCGLYVGLTLISWNYLVMKKKKKKLLPKDDEITRSLLQGFQEQMEPRRQIKSAITNSSSSQQDFVFQRVLTCIQG
jgi:hypothetical protein